jgi:superfamily II DNA or RNA helicase
MPAIQTGAVRRIVGVSRDFDAEIAQARKRLAELDRLRADAAARLQALGRLRASPRAELHASDGAERSPAAKVRLFRDLFSGREDVFAVRWENRARGRAGYAPRCDNEWRQGVCGKPKVRCGACRNQAFVVLDDRELLAHLQGHQVVGIYPLLSNDTCRLLAIDLDGSSWQTDSRAIRETCRSLELEPAIERSRSGNGAHIWFFFMGAVAAADARRLGFMILTRTMASGAALGVDSYDRLFPSQDVLPSGGFGNLIALPLQLHARKVGNTEFLNDELEPHQDQWSYLAEVPKIAPDLLGELIAQSDEDEALGVRSPTEGSPMPWRPPRPLRERLREESMPEAVVATLADRLYVDRSALPPALAHAIKRLATFSNPMFLERQRMRMSVARTPRVIGCFEDLAQHIAVPRGCLAEAEALLAEFGVRLEVEDERVNGEPLAIQFDGNLNETQQRAVDAMLVNETGVLSAPPGWGKTVVATSLIAARGCSTLVLVHRKPLVEQWAERLSEFSDISPNAIGRIGGGRRRRTMQIDIAMVQTLARAEGANELLRAYGHVVIDECHHVPAVSIERLLAAIPARYVTGLTATPYRRDGHQPIINMQCGPIRHAVDARTVRQQHGLELLILRRDTSFDPSLLPSEASIQEIYGALAADEDRLQLVVADARELLNEGRAVMILTERRDHLERLAVSLRNDVPNVVVLHGGIQGKARRAALQHLADVPDDEPRLVLATGRYIGEGFDDPRLDTLLLTMPIAWKGTVVQYAGRLHRAHPAKRDARIYDYVDSDVPVLRRMYGKRLRAYQKMGYSTHAQLEYAT